MIAPDQFYRELQYGGVDFFTGVPDSLLKNFLLYLQHRCAPQRHIVSTNEGQAIALAAGYYLATGELPMVYMQNSGLGNAVNPLTSLADREVYSIPMLLLIGWRGRPGVKDESQHVKMGGITTGMLDLMDIPYIILDEDYKGMKQLIQRAVFERRPVAMLVKENSFEKSKYAAAGEAEKAAARGKYAMTREEVLKKLVAACGDDDTMVCTTGKSGREFYELNDHVQKTFLSVGAMGLANQVALGLNMFGQGRTIMIDGDGAILMHLGTMPLIGKWATDSFVHIVINNGVHESVGGQPTIAMETDLCAIASASGYGRVQRIVNMDELTAWLKGEFAAPGKQFAEIRVNTDSRKDLLRPTIKPAHRAQELLNLFLSR